MFSVVFPVVFLVVLPVVFSGNEDCADLS